MTARKKRPNAAFSREKEREVGGGGVASLGAIFSPFLLFLPPPPPLSSSSFFFFFLWQDKRANRRLCSISRGNDFIYWLCCRGCHFCEINKVNTFAVSSIICSLPFHLEIKMKKKAPASHRGRVQREPWQTQILQ